MEEVSETAEVLEVAPQETPIQEPKNEQPEPSPVESKQDKDWRAVRHRINELENEVKKRDALLEKVISLQSQPQNVAVKPEEPEEPDEEYIPKGKVKSLTKKAVEPLEKKVQELEEKLEKKHQQDLLQSLKSRYPDFDEIVNAETLNLLEEKDPELAQTIGELKDPYKIGIQAYKYIKSSGILDDIPNKRRVKEVEKRMEKNEKTVQTPQAYDKRPMAQAFRLTEEEKSKLYEEMTQYGSMASSVPELR
ncbi:MAG TPA: hypothetical protein VGK47_14900 [Nitrososphaeraceae archaeon]